MKKLSSKKEYLVIYGLVLCVLAVASFLCPPFYSMNDDAMMKSILSGAYSGTPDGHAVYMKYPLTGIISLLYRFTKGISWFDLVMTGCFWVSVASVICRVLTLIKNAQGRQKKAERVWGWLMILAVGSLCLAIFLPHLLTMHYTLVAAMTGGCALFLVVTGGGWLWVVFLILCYCIRSQVFFMLLPFLGVTVLWRMACRKDKALAVQLAVQLAVLAVGTLVCMVWNGWMYSGDDWQQYMQYNDSRTRLYDYDGLLPYEGNEALFAGAGISREQYSILEQYVLVLDQGVSAEMMDSAAGLAAQKRSEQQSGGEHLVQCIKEYYYHIRYTDAPYNLLMLGGYLLVMVLLLRKRYIVRALLLCCMGGGRSLIWIYLIWRGRFPERIYVSLYFLDIMILAGMAVELLLEKRQAAKAQESRRQIVRPVLVALACLVFWAAGAQQLKVMYERTAEQSAKQRKWEALVQYCEAHPDTLFLLDVRSVVNYTGKVWSVGAQENYLLAGGWMSGSPLLEKRLGNVADGGEVFAGQTEKCCYIIGADRGITWLQEYCNARFSAVQLEKTDSVSLDGTELFYVYCPSGH